LAAAAVLGALLIGAPAPAVAQSLTDQPFTAYGTGTAVAAQALQLGATQLAGVQAAFSGGSVASQGLGGPINNEFGQNVQPPLNAKNAYGRGAGIEIGVATPIPQGTDLNQIILSGRAEASAPPPSALVDKQIALNLNPIAFSSTLRGQAKALFDPAVCPIGRPLTFGLGNAENLQLLNSGTVGPNGFTAPLLGTSISTGNPRAANQSRTVTYLISNGDGTFGVVSETRQTVAPVAIGAATGVTLEIAGEFGLKATATGKPGGAKVEYTGNPVITLKSGSTVLTQLTLQQLLGTNGLSVPIPPLLTVNLGTPPRTLGAASGPPRQDADGTVASGAVDAARIKLLTIPGVGALDVALGHMEAAVSVPAGGLKCNIPVSKVANPDPITVGNDFTFSISIPSDPGLFAAFFNCDLIGIKATDTVETLSGNPRIQLLSADHGGVVSGNTVTWSDLGNYVLGQPPIILTISARVPATSGAGVFRDTVNVTANLGNCRGGATGEDIVNGNSTITGRANLDGGAITGTFTLNGPQVTRGNLAATGGNSWPLVAGGGLLFVALGLTRLRRKASPATAKR
jgi:hypothetical protein